MASAFSTPRWVRMISSRCNFSQTFRPHSNCEGFAICVVTLFCATGHMLSMCASLANVMPTSGSVWKGLWRSVSAKWLPQGHTGAIGLLACTQPCPHEQTMMDSLLRCGFVCLEWIALVEGLRNQASTRSTWQSLPTAGRSVHRLWKTIPVLRWNCVATTDVFYFSACSPFPSSSLASLPLSSRTCLCGQPLDRPSWPPLDLHLPVARHDARRLEVMRCLFKVVGPKNSEKCVQIGSKNSQKRTM